MHHDATYPTPLILISICSALACILRWRFGTNGMWSWTDKEKNGLGQVYFNGIKAGNGTFTNVSFILHWIGFLFFWALRTETALDAALYGMAWHGLRIGMGHRHGLKCSFIPSFPFLYILETGSNGSPEALDDQA